MGHNIDVTIRGGFAPSIVDSGTLGMLSGGSFSKDFVVADVSDNQQLNITSVRVSTVGDPSFDEDYDYNYEWTRQWNNSESQIDITITVTWDDDPGLGNDITLRYEVLA